MKERQRAHEGTEGHTRRGQGSHQRVLAPCFRNQGPDLREG